MTTLEHDPTTNMSEFDRAVAELDDILAEARNWADGTPLKNEEQAQAVTRLDQMLHTIGRKLDMLRIAEKKPLDDAVKAIQDRYNPFIQPKRGKVDIARAALNPLLVAWRTKERERKEAEAAKARAEAEALAAEAQAAIRASAGNLEQRERAEEQLALAKEAEGFAHRREKAAVTGNGLRSTPRAVLTDLSAAIRHYWAINQAAFAELVIELATADVRTGKRDIPGFEIKIEERAL